MKLSLTFQLNHLAYRTQRAALKALVTHACKATFAHEHTEKPDLTVLLSDDSAIQALNTDFRGKDNPTNVLSFPSGEAGYLGDVIVSLDTVAQEAKDQGKPFEHHLAHLIIHACLHLLGHDHRKEKEAQVMEAKEIKILQSLDIANPYD